MATQDQSFVLLILLQTEMVSGNPAGLKGGEQRSSAWSVILLGGSVMVMAINPSRDLGIDGVTSSQTFFLKGKQKNGWKGKPGIGDFVLPNPWAS